MVIIDHNYYPTSGHLKQLVSRLLKTTTNETLIVTETYKAKGHMFIHTEMPPLSEYNVVIT